MAHDLSPIFELSVGPDPAEQAGVEHALRDSIPPLPSYEEVVRRYPRLADATCVFISGSLVDGWGNERSDLDIFVIAPEARIAGVIPDSVARIGGDSDDGHFDAMGTVGGFRADIEFWSEEHVDALIGKAQPRDEPYLGRAGEPDAAEQDLLYRLHIGMPLSGHEWLAERKRRIDASDFSVWLAENYKVDGENQLDDLIGMIASNDVKSAVLMARDTYLSAVQAVLAHRGDISPSSKWIAHRLARADIDDLPMDDAWNILTMRDCTDADWPIAVARKAHRLFLAVEQSIAGHTRCGTASPRGIERRLGVRTFRNDGATVVADVARHRTGDVGGYIWSMCDGAHAEDDMARCLARDLGLSPADAAEHVAAAVDELRASGLIT
ncbi:PqqD family peptide modification chaperone [Streptomyces tendae]|uniref:PqqD family peptide modification chaperone n=1 Tax=Streptomyces tendae TaxID=1932 RepID=UPI003713C36A